jgi:hypothetical protein
MARRRTLREFAGTTDAKTRTARLLRTVANELERLGVRWNEQEDAGTAFFDFASWMTLSASDSDYEAVSLKAPRGIKGCLLVHRAVLQS